MWCSHVLLALRDFRFLQAAIAVRILLLKIGICPEVGGAKILHRRCQILNSLEIKQSDHFSVVLQDNGNVSCPFPRWEEKKTFFLCRKLWLSETNCLEENLSFPKFWFFCIFAAILNILLFSPQGQSDQRFNVTHSVSEASSLSFNNLFVFHSSIVFLLLEYLFFSVPLCFVFVTLFAHSYALMRLEKPVSTYPLFLFSCKAVISAPIYSTEFKFFRFLGVRNLNFPKIFKF